jgi:hypothetical protein
MAQPSESTARPSRVRLLSERTISPSESDAPQTVTSYRAEPEARPSTPSNGRFLEEMSAILATLAMMLSARLLLLLSVCGAFWLGWESIREPTSLKLMGAGSYDLLVVIPLVLLYYRRG